ncbi:MAG TPA: DUF3455 domain-containing protein [Pseudolabrys sp.]
MQIDSARRETDCHRQEALSLRAQTSTRFFRQLGRVARPLTGSVAIIAAYIFALRLISLPAAAEVPSAIAAPGETLVVMAHAVGAQVYECKSDSAGKLAWQFREPIATLLIDGKTVGRHYAGPTWEMSDGSAVSAKVSSRAPGAAPGDIPLLKLEATAWNGSGKLNGIATIQRLNTHGGSAEGACNSSGAFLSVPTAPTTLFSEKPANHIELANGE